MVENLLRNLEAYDPTLYEHMESYRQISNFELVVVRDDGRKYLYDDMLHGFRRLADDSDNMTEEQVKREFGRRLKQMLNIKGMTQKELSEAIGVSQISLSKYITGDAAPSFPKVDKIAKVLNCSVDYFRHID